MFAACQSTIWGRIRHAAGVLRAFALDAARVLRAFGLNAARVLRAFGLDAARVLRAFGLDAAGVLRAFALLEDAVEPTPAPTRAEPVPAPSHTEPPAQSAPAWQIAPTRDVAFARRTVSPASVLPILREAPAPDRTAKRPAPGSGGPAGANATHPSPALDPHASGGPPGSNATQPSPTLDPHASGGPPGSNATQPSPTLDPHASGGPPGSNATQPSLTLDPPHAAHPHRRRLLAERRARRPGTPEPAPMPCLSPVAPRAQLGGDDRRG